MTLKCRVFGHRWVRRALEQLIPKTNKWFDRCSRCGATQESR